MIGTLQDFSLNSNDINDSIFESQKIESELYQYILENNLTEARKFVIEKNYNYTELYSEFFRTFVPMLAKDKQSQVIMLLAQYALWDGQVVDRELNFSAAMLEIMGILNG